jgi:hypothetical protein
LGELCERIRLWAKAQAFLLFGPAHL